MNRNTEISGRSLYVLEANDCLFKLDLPTAIRNPGKGFKCLSKIPDLTDFCLGYGLFTLSKGGRVNVINSRRCFKIGNSLGSYYSVIKRVKSNLIVAGCIEQKSNCLVVLDQKLSRIRASIVYTPTPQGGRPTLLQKRTGPTR